MQVHNQEIHSTEISNLVTWDDLPANIGALLAVHCARHSLDYSIVGKDNIIATFKVYATPEQATAINRLIEVTGTL